MNIVNDGSTFLKKQYEPPTKRCPEIIMSLVHRRFLHKYSLQVPESLDNIDIICIDIRYDF